MVKKFSIFSIFLIAALFTAIFPIWASPPFNRNLGPPGMFRSAAKPATPPGKMPSLIKNTVSSGTVSAILTSQSAFILNTRQGLQTVQTDDQTKFVRGFASLKLGERLVTVGQLDEQKILVAKRIIVSASESKTQRRAVYGLVEQKSSEDLGTSLVLRHPKTSATFQVIVNTQTRITGKGLLNPTVNNVGVGNRVVAVGTVDESGEIMAKHLHIIPGSARGLLEKRPSTSPASRFFRVSGVTASGRLVPAED